MEAIMQIMTRKRLVGAAAAMALLTAGLGVSACGSSTSDRALSGGAIGAGAGAVGGAVMGAPLTGAVIGGAAGAATGAMTDEDQINLGKPAWR
jgi:osmotically inducible lipoprotein OsmB